jgi:hypothetical protein
MENNSVLKAVGVLVLFVLFEIAVTYVIVELVCTCQ